MSILLFSGSECRCLAVSRRHCRARCLFALYYDLEADTLLQITHYDKDDCQCYLNAVLSSHRGSVTDFVFIPLLTNNVQTSFLIPLRNPVVA